MPACRLSAVPHAVAAKTLTEPSLARYCAHPSCTTLVLTLPGATRTRTCLEHAGQRPPVESDDAFMARMCVAMGWRRTKQ
jgi:hypothetical protein